MVGKHPGNSSQAEAMQGTAPRQVSVKGESAAMKMHEVVLCGSDAIEEKFAVGRIPSAARDGDQLLHGGNQGRRHAGVVGQGRGKADMTRLCQIGSEPLHDLPNTAQVKNGIGTDVQHPRPVRRWKLQRLQLNTLLLSIL